MSKIVLEYLLNEKNIKSKSKLKNLEYTKLEIQKYLTSDQISTRSKKLMFRARTRMLQVGDNFGNKDELCPLCFLEKNDQPHIIQCLVVQFKCPEVFDDTSSKYEDIFSNEPGKMYKIIKLIDVALRKREQILQQIKIILTYNLATQDTIKIIKTNTN